MSKTRALKRFLLRLLPFARVRPRPHPLAAGLSFAAVALLACASITALGCMNAISPRAKLDEAVQDMNTAARFGRIDVATERVASSVRPEFLKRHRLWGNDVRIVDVEFGSIEKMTDKEATLFVNFSWFRPTEGTLRATQVRQTWKNADGNADTWALYSEERAAGDIGLLGEPPIVVLKPERVPARFETTRIPGG